MSSYLVSTIIPVYNRPEMVKRAVHSVLSQTYRPIEIILVDDGSTDNTHDVLLQLQSCHRDEIRVFRQANSGAGLARETGRLMAQGDFIQYLDSDDYLLPNKFVDQVEALNAHPECSIAYGTSRLEDQDGSVISLKSRYTGVQIDTLFPLLLVERWWHTHTPLFRRWLSDAAGAWPSFRPEDWDLEARMAALNPRLIHCNSTVSVQVNHDSTNRVTCGNADAYLRDEAIFLPRLHACALIAGVSPLSPEMSIFSRWCFLRARQLDAIGESELASSLLALATYAGQSLLDIVPAWQKRVYAALRPIVSPRLCGSLACMYHPRSPRTVGKQPTE